jgi:hypothetical protein
MAAKVAAKMILDCDIQAPVIHIRLLLVRARSLWRLTQGERQPQKLASFNLRAAFESSCPRLLTGGHWY